jgi:hypothetical protein
MAPAGTGAAAFTKPPRTTNADRDRRIDDRRPMHAELTSTTTTKTTPTRTT